MPVPEEFVSLQFEIIHKMDNNTTIREEEIKNAMRDKGTSHRIPFIEVEVGAQNNFGSHFMSEYGFLK